MIYFRKRWMILMVTWSLDRPTGFMMMPLYSGCNCVYPRYFCCWQTSCRGLFWSSDYRAYAGGVAKFDGGWGIGIMPIEIVGKVDWIPADINHVDLIHVHQDQVITLPQDAVRLAGSNFAKTLPLPLANGFLRYRDIQNLPRIHQRAY